MSVLINELRKEAARFRANGERHNAATMTSFADLLESQTLPSPPEPKSTSQVLEQLPTVDARIDRACGKIAATCGAEQAIAPAPAQRTLTDHAVNGLNAGITIEPRGAPGAGGAHTQYVLLLRQNPHHPASRTLIIDFQSKPINGPDDFDGFTNEALLAIVIDRLRGFQGMPPVHPVPHGVGGDMARLAPNPPKFQCRENATALTHLETALMWLHKRTRDRVARGVEGSHAP